MSCLLGPPPSAVCVRSYLGPNVFNPPHRRTTMSTNDETKTVPHFWPHGSDLSVPNDGSLVIASAPADFETKIESVEAHPLPGSFEFASPKALKEGAPSGSLAPAAGDVERNWSAPDGLMTAILGERPSVAGLEISLNDDVFVTANIETAVSVFPVCSLASFVAYLVFLTIRIFPPGIHWRRSSPKQPSTDIAGDEI